MNNLDLSTEQLREQFKTELLKTLETIVPDLLRTPSRKKQRRRVMHFIPAHKDEYLAKINELDADTILLDLEDSVPRSQKDKARENILKLDRNILGQKELCIRVNFGDKKDLELVHRVKPDLIMVPKLNNASDLYSVKKRIDKNLEIFAVLETINSYKNAEEIIKVPGVTAIVFGAEDFYSELSVRYRLRKGDIVNNQEDRDKYLRFIQPLIMLATQYDIQFIDGVHTYLKDGEDYEKAQKHLETECEMIRKEGVLGKISIHPTQIEIIKKAFDLEASEINTAVEKLKIFDENTAVIVEEGAMQDTPETAAAKRILRDALRYL